MSIDLEFQQLFYGLGALALLFLLIFLGYLIQVIRSVLKIVKRVEALSDVSGWVDTGKFLIKQFRSKS